MMFNTAESVLIVEAENTGKFSKLLYNMIGKNDDTEAGPTGPVDGSVEIGNPLGARALYLYEGPKDTLFRIHGTFDPKSIGTNASSGCIRMANADVMDLYERVKVGTRVVVR